MHTPTLPEIRPNSAPEAAGLPPVAATVLPFKRPPEAPSIVINRLTRLRADVVRLQAAISTNARLRALMWRELEGCRFLLDASLADATEDQGGRDHG
jgi:Tfp pilus assembly protein PilN